MSNLTQDIRYGLRTLLRNRGFTAIAVMTLALGIGANSAIFSVVDAVLLNPLAYKDPDRLVVVWERNTAIQKDEDLVAPLNYLEWIKRGTEFEELAAFRYGGYALTGREYPEQIGTLFVTTNLFRTLGVEPILGRTFTDDEVQRGDRVVLLNYDFWQKTLGGDRSIIGAALTLNNASFTVIGVLPRGFGFPDGQPPSQTYSPLTFVERDLAGRRSHTLTVIGRMKAGATIESASANLAAVARAITAEDPTSNPEIKLASIHDELVSEVRLGLLVLLGTVGFVLLIACANVANLLLVRSSTRRRELAIRTALGAKRWRVVRQLLTESLLLSIAGGAAGTFLSWWTLDLFVRFSPPDLPRMDQVAVNADVLLFVTAVSVLTGIGFGLVPALQISRNNLGTTMKEGAVNISGSRRQQAGRSLLVIGEIALSLILVAGAGLMIRTVMNLQQLNHGFEPRNVLTMQLFLSASSTEGLQPGPLFAELLRRIRSLPGVEAAGAVTSLPLNSVGIDFDMPVVIEGRPPSKPGEEPQADFRVATTGYLEAMRIRLLQGRVFTEFDSQDSTPVMLINDALANRLFPGQNPLGQRVRLYGRSWEIVGVTAAVRHEGFRQEPRPEMTLPHQQRPFSGMTLVMRSEVDPSALAASVRREVHSLLPNQPVYRERTMQRLIDESIAQPRFTALLLGSFAVLALVLAIVGVYGVISFTVAQSTNEIGLRIALGAGRTDVIRTIVRRGLMLAMLGIGIGLGGTMLLTRLMTGLVFGVSTMDPATLLAASTVLAAATLAGTYLPARRAARVDPVVALRHQ